MIPMPYLNHCSPIDEDLYPSSDIAQDGLWLNEASGSSLYDHIDNAASDAEYVEYQGEGSECPTTDQEAFTVHMTDPSSAPAKSACQTLRVRYRAGLLGSDPGCGDLDVVLLQGASTTIASDSVSLSSGYTTFSFLLTDTEYDNITDHDDLRLEITGYQGVDDLLNSDVLVRVSYARLEYRPK